MHESPDDIRLATRETVRTGRYAMLGCEPSRAARIWFALHGYGQLAARFLRPFLGLVPADSCVVAPEGLNRFYRAMPSADRSHLQHVGATWMTREAREDDIADTQRWLDAVYAGVMDGRDDVAVGVLGFSQGVATATRWIAEGRTRVDAFVVWAGAPAADVSPERLHERLHRADVTFVAGDEDAFFDAATRGQAIAAVQAMQPAARALTFRGGHVIDPATLAPLLGSLTRRT